ncbi:MAG: recombination mediator RecR [Parvibaculales bacterium]
MYGPEIDQLIKLLSRLPGLGPRSARRAVLQLIRKRETLLLPLTDALAVARDKIVTCEQCGSIDTQSPCAICADPRRDVSVLCVVEDVADLWALERAQAIKGHYHVLGGILSALDGVGPEDLNLASLLDKCRKGEIKEVILAMNATVEGQSTAHYIMDMLSQYEIKVTRLAHGVPVGGELDYLDDGTLAAAMNSRREI